MHVQKKQHHLPTTLRPEEVAQWMKEGRDYEKLPVIADPVDYGARWKAWWASLQPACRRVEGAWPSLARVAPTDAAEWENVWRGGPCGLFLVVSALSWWLWKATDNEGPFEDVHAMIQDVSWAIRTAMDAHNVKHGARTPEGAPAEKRARVE